LTKQSSRISEAHQGGAKDKGLSKGGNNVSDDGSPLALLVEGLTKNYGSRRALDTVSMSVGRGEFVALLGPNGAGKSTLFQLLSGLFGADAGRIVVAGHDLKSHPTLALARFGIVFQQPTLDLELSVEANLRFHAGLHGMPSALARRRAADLLEQFGLAARAKDPARALSGGTRRRLELARALMHEPTILLMDEATVGLDPASRLDLLRIVSEMRTRRGVAVLWATHLCEEVAEADRVIVLHQGHVLKDCAPRALMEDTGKSTIVEAFVALTAGPSHEAA
jgi:ABC-2 type transport system ATP-binding protein